MVKLKLTRKISLKGKNNIRIHSDILEEEVTEDEYRGIYEKRTKELYDLKELAAQAKAELKEIQAIAVTPELNKFTEMLIKADKLKNKETTIETLKKVEKEIKQDEIELEQFTPVMQKLQRK